MTNLASSAPHIHNAADFDDLVDWGTQPDPLAGTCVLFPAGWSGEAEIFETIRNIYMLS